MNHSQIAANNPERQTRLLAATVFAVTFVGCLVVHRPSRYYFFGDSWGALHELLIDWKNVLHPHNEHLIPFFKAFYLLEYKLFGANHLLYMVVGFALHAANATLVYLLGRRLSLRPWPAVAAALIFGLSWVHWEVIGWSFEQCFMLTTLFMLLAIRLFWEDAHRGKILVWVAIVSLAAYWSAAVSIALPFLLLVSYLLWWANRTEPVGRVQVFKSFSAMWLPLVVYLASLRATMTFASVLAINKTHLSLYSLPPVIDLTVFSVTYGLILPSLTFTNPQSLASGPLILLLLVLFLGFCYRRLDSVDERRAFWFLLCFLLLPPLAVSGGRLQWGPAHALSSHYQYLPMAAFALLVALCGQTLRNTLRQKRTQVWFSVIAVVLLAYYVDFHAHWIRRVNPATDRGMQTQQFLRLARQATYPDSIPPSGTILGPELAVPDFVHAPGSFLLWKVFQVLEGNTRTVVPVGDYLRRQDASLAANLARNGGFEALLSEREWERSGGARLKRTDSVAHAGRFSAETVLPGKGSSLSQDVIQSCPAPLSGRIFTFSVQVETPQAKAVEARILFKDQASNVLGEFRSPPNPGGEGWNLLVVSGLAPPSTCIVGVSVVNESSTEVTAAVDDVILLAHPAALDREGNLVFRPLEEIVPSRSRRWAQPQSSPVVEGRNSHGR